MCINRKSTLNIPIVFIMQTTVNKLKKKNLADGNILKIGRKHDCGGIGLKRFKYSLADMGSIGFQGVLWLGKPAYTHL